MYNVCVIIMGTNGSPCTFLACLFFSRNSFICNTILRLPASRFQRLHEKLWLVDSNAMQWYR